MAPLRYSAPCGVRRLDVSLGIRAKSLVELRAACMPDAARAGFRVLRSRRKGHPPVLTSSKPLSTVHRRLD